MGFGKKRNRCRGKCCGVCRPSNASEESGKTTLDLIPDEGKVIVLANNDVKTLEMGLHPGSVVTMAHNDPSERNIIVRSFEQRLVISREAARNILVRESSKG